MEDDFTIYGDIPADLHWKPVGLVTLPAGDQNTVDELAERLGVAPTQPGFLYALVIQGDGGRAYSWIDLLMAHMDWVERQGRG